MRKTILVEEFNELTHEEQLGWWPEYLGYKTKKERKYEVCELGYKHFLGWEEITTPIGQLLRYFWQEPTAFERVNHMMIPRIVDSINNSNTLTARMLSSWVSDEN